jgi:hypothetical protein
MDAAVQEIAEATELPSPQKPSRLARPPASITPETQSDGKRITQADVEREINWRRTERVQRELVTTAVAILDTEPEPEPRPPARKEGGHAGTSAAPGG